MKIPNFTIRLLTIASYFLPFIFFLTTCTAPLSSTDAYNQADAIENEKAKALQKIIEIDALINSVDSNNVDSVLSEIQARTHADYLASDNISNFQFNKAFPFYKISMPTNYSLSGIGTIWFHKNILGKVLITISLILSFFIFAFWKFITKKRLANYVISLNIFIVFVFITDCVFTNVELLYGIWVLLFLLIIQLLTEIKSKPSNA